MSSKEKKSCKKTTPGMKLPGCPWISATGFDGSGKTSFLDLLEKYLVSKGLRVKRSRLPHDPYLVKDLLNQYKDVSDPWTDRLLFALDNRTFAHELSQWINSGEYDVIITQRCFLDSFVHGRVQGYSYKEIGELNGINDLPREQVLIHMVATAEIAYGRIKDDPDADKFEIPEYMTVQERETRRAYDLLERGGKPALKHFDGCINIFVDTTNLTIEETFEYVLSQLREKGIIE